jgi:putative acetyltransferase
VSAATITVSPLNGAEDVRAFRDLNVEWIERFFVLEAADLAVLEDPETAIVEPGGTVLLARDGDERVGCVALLRHGDEAELVKMAVTPTRRGAGIGRLLITAAIDAAKAAGVRRLTLESNRALVAAVRMYESAGFRHVAAEERVPSPYARADVFMDLDLG